MIDFFAKAKDAGFCIKEESGLISIEGDWAGQYNQQTGEFNKECPINVTGSTINEINKEMLVVEKKKGLRITLKHRFEGKTRSIEYSW